MEMENLAGKFTPMQGEELTEEKAGEATRRLESEQRERVLEEVSKGVVELLDMGYNLDEVLESIRKEVEGNNGKKNLH